MKKTEIETQNPLDTKPHITEVLNDHPLIQWIVENRTKIATIFVVIIISTFTVIRFSTGAPGQKEAQLIETEMEVVNLQRAILGINPETTVDAAFEKVNKLLKQYPELNTKYDAPLAQAFLVANHTKDAVPFAEQSLNRTRANDLNLYQDFAKTSLLIGQEKYQEALDQALKLNEGMKQESSVGNTLFAYNLLRIATLYQALGNKKEELNTWNAWNDYAKNSKSNEAFLKVTNQLEAGKIKLTDYIAHREKDLKK